MGILEPDRYFSSLAAIDIKHDLIGRGLDCVLLDIDNTLRSRQTNDVPHAQRIWLARARDAGVRFCLLSNNWHSSVHRFAEDLEIPIVAKACKPLPFAYGKALRLMDASKSETVAIGDQLTTDVLGAHLAGIQAWLVLPLSDVDVLRTQLVRAFERALIGTRQPEGAPVSAEGAAVLAQQTGTTQRGTTEQ